MLFCELHLAGNAAVRADRPYRGPAIAVSGGAKADLGDEEADGVERTSGWRRSAGLVYIRGCAKPLSTECRTGTTATFSDESGFCCFKA